MKINYTIMSLATVLLIACSSPAPEAEEAESTNETEEVVAEEVEVQEESSVYFVNLEDGIEVKSPLKVVMGVKGMEVEPAGEVKEGYGHHHLIIDGAFIPEGEIVPSTETTIHYGKGQKEVELVLSPGSHTITMQFADGFHASYGESMSKTITVNVIE